MGILCKTKGVVVAKVEGGLGNQLFIYATARRLAIKNDVPLKLDIVSGYTKDGYGRSYRLDCFNIDAQVASLDGSYLSSWGRQKRYLAKKINRVLPFRFKTYIVEESPFDRRLLNLRVSKRVYLQGYWQDERYFKDIESILKKELTLIEPLDEKNRQWRKKIENTNAVCLHARRNEYEHALPAVYYKRAIEYLSRRINKPHFFCFSDNPNWIKKNIPFNFPFSVITHNNECEYKDLMLMTRCKHYIIANSTFSWWGAWLNPAPDTIVIAPAYWGHPTGIPESWRTIEC